MFISVAVTLFTALVLLDPVGEVDAENSRLVIHTPQKIKFIHRYHTSEHYARDYGYNTHHSHHHVHRKPKKVVHHHHHNRRGRGKGRKRYVWRKVGDRTPYVGGKSFGMSNYAVNYRNWEPTQRRRSRPRGVRPRGSPRHQESYLQPPRDDSDYDSYAAHWEEDLGNESDSNEIADYLSAPSDSGIYRPPHNGAYEPLEDDPGQGSATYGSYDSSEVGTYNAHNLDAVRTGSSTGTLSSYRVTYKVGDRGSGHVQGYSTLPDGLTSQFASSSNRNVVPKRPAVRQETLSWQNDHVPTYRERARPSRHEQQQQHSLRSTNRQQDQTFGSSSTQHRQHSPPANVLWQQNSDVPQRHFGSPKTEQMLTTPRSRTNEDDVYLQAFRSFSYRKQQQRQKERANSQLNTGPQGSMTPSQGSIKSNQWLQSTAQARPLEKGNNRGISQQHQWPQVAKDTSGDHDIGYGEGLEDLNDEFRF